MTSGTFGCNTYTANSIYSRDNVISYLFVYCVGTMVYRRHYMVDVVYSFFDNQRSIRRCFVDISTFLGLGYWVVTCLSRFGTVVATLIYIAIITLTGVSLAYLFSGGATIFVIVGIMFSLNALFIFYLNISSGLFRPLIFMAVSGIIAAIVVNSLVASSTMVWVVSVLTVLVWTLITALEKSTLHGYARTLYHSEFSSLPRCALLGALTLYLGIINAVATLCRYIILMVLEILSSFRP